MFTLKELSQVIHAQLVNCEADIQVSGFSIDSRTIKPQDVFIALSGNNVDGHEYVSAALAKGAVAAIVSKDMEQDVPHIKVTDCQKALQDIAHYYRCRLDTKIVSLSGTCGKTSTKELLNHVLSQYFTCYATQGNYNNHIGVPLSLLSVPESSDFAVIECGTNQPGDLDLLGTIVQPDVVTLTCIGQGHLQGLGDLDGVQKAKSEIWRHTAQAPVAIVNVDDERIVKGLMLLGINTPKLSLLVRILMLMLIL